MNQEQIILRELVRFWRQFGLLISSGVPILESLNILRSEATLPQLREAITRIHAAVQGGETVHTGLSQTPSLFSSGVLALCRAGEAGGVLHKITERIAEGLENGALLVSGPPGALAATPEPEPEAEPSAESIIQRTSEIIDQAFRSGASDIHIEPTPRGGHVRLRIDGALQAPIPLDQETYNAVISRIMIMANVDVAEKRRPQDGRIRLNIRGREVDLRCSFTSVLVDGPVGRNYSVVLRLLDPQSAMLNIEQLGATGETLATFRSWAKRPNGIYVVTGPTGSGKTTVLYSLVSLTNTAEQKVISIENPVEYLIQGVLQMEVWDSLGATFPRLLRSALRQDPDVILVGEIRDYETAAVVVQAALTGHLVFTTLHTNNATTVPRRLIDIGIDPWLVSDSLAGSAAVRLVRTVCAACKEPDRPQSLDVFSGLPDEADLRRATFVRGKGCEKCRGTGYRGRTAIFEIMPESPRLREMIARNAHTDELRVAAVEAGMVTMRHEGIRKAAQGVTTLREVLSVTMGIG